MYNWQRVVRLENDGTFIYAICQSFPEYNQINIPHGETISVLVVMSVRTFGKGHASNCLTALDVVTYIRKDMYSCGLVMASCV